MYMASVKKFTESAVVNQLRHIERTIAHPENMDIKRWRYQTSGVPDRTLHGHGMEHRQGGKGRYFQSSLSFPTT